MKAARPSHIHTWCYAHILNLVISDSSNVSVAAFSLFGLITELGTFSMIPTKGGRSGKSICRQNQEIRNA